MSAHPRRAGATALVIDLPVPIVISYGLRSAGVDLYLAVLSAAIAPGIGAVIGVIRRGRVEPLAALSLTGLAVAVALSLAGGGPRLLLAKEGWGTGITGVWFLVSARSSRPLALLLTEPFLPHARWGFTADWGSLWERQPRFRRIWRTSSVLWGLGTLTDSIVARGDRLHPAHRRGPRGRHRPLPRDVSAADRRHQRLLRPRRPLDPAAPLAQRDDRRRRSASQVPVPTRLTPAERRQ